MLLLLLLKYKYTWFFSLHKQITENTKLPCCSDYSEGRYCHSLKITLVGLRRYLHDSMKQASWMVDNIPNTIPQTSVTLLAKRFEVWSQSRIPRLKYQHRSLERLRLAWGPVLCVLRSRNLREGLRHVPVPLGGSTRNRADSPNGCYLII